MLTIFLNPFFDVTVEFNLLFILKPPLFFPQEMYSFNDMFISEMTKTSNESFMTNFLYDISN